MKECKGDTYYLLKNTYVQETNLYHFTTARYKIINYYSLSNFCGQLQNDNVKIL